MKSIINAHNSKVLADHNKQTAKRDETCNCRGEAKKYAHFKGGARLPLWYTKLRTPLTLILKYTLAAQREPSKKDIMGINQTSEMNQTDTIPHFHTTSGTAKTGEKSPE